MVFRWNQLRRLVCNAFADIASRTRINRVSAQSQGRHAGTVLKRRVRGASLLRWPGNLLFRFRELPVSVLNTRDWHAWERLVSNRTSAGDGRQLGLQRLPGLPLSDLLAATTCNPNGCWNESAAHITAAFSALRELHASLLEHPTFGPISVSHGDASVSNVMIDCSANMGTRTSARWFDFDVRHDLRAPAVARQADDLRALLFTAAMLIPRENHGALVSVAHHAYSRAEGRCKGVVEGHADVWQQLVEQVSANRHAWDVFHRSQCLRAARRMPVLQLGAIDRSAIEAVDAEIVRSVKKMVP